MKGNRALKRRPSVSRLGRNESIDALSRSVQERSAEHSMVQKEIAYWTSQRKSSCMWYSVVGFLGLVLAIIENEVLWYGMQHLWDPTTYLIVLKSATILSTIITISFLLKYYESLINIRRMHGVLLTPGMSWNGLRGAGLLYPLFWDILFLIPQPFPFLDVDITLWDHGLGRESMYNADTILCCIMFSRCRFVPRFYGEVFSDLSSETAVAIGRLNQLSIDASFIMKYVIANSLQVVSVLFGLQVFMFSYLMMCAERPTEGGALHDFANCMWLVVITMTTVGYGDEYPTTMLGRVVSVGASVTAVIMLGIVINLVVSKLSLSRQESKVIEVMERIQLRKDLKMCACIVMQRWFRAYRRINMEEKGPKLGKQLGGSGYQRIPDFPGHVADQDGHGLIGGKKARVLASKVLADTEMLVAIIDFAQLRRQTFANQLQVDITEMVGNLSSKLSIQEKRIAMMKEKTKHLNELIDLLTNGDSTAAGGAAGATAPFIA